MTPIAEPTIVPSPATADRFNFAPFNFILTPLEALRRVRQLPPGAQRDINFSAKLVYNRRKSKNQAAPLPLFVGPDAGNGNLLDTIIDRRRPTRSIRSE